MRKRTPLAVLAVGLLVVIGGCAVKLTPAGAMVREGHGPAVSARCEFLGIVEADDKTAAVIARGTAGSRGRSLDRWGAHGSNVMREIRNKVAELGGNVFVSIGGDRFEVQAEAYRCAHERR